MDDTRGEHAGGWSRCGCCSVRARGYRRWDPVHAQCNTNNRYRWGDCCQWRKCAHCGRRCCWSSVGVRWYCHGGAVWHNG
ncbi:hypothetical protein BU25DRAFT_18865 [Macroventuria anomochaeta]|uniref:Uncharacterized protein n=1 Tax=Macroventuria anomochaeta TaxID=301207 RepID=A0ACB6S7S7_9PLEO|nr:uncharacterized protein BU25DRAFT_18865 [Macroventuria anomochaeta]KAF2629259.1 hypothetical protein BU25DRAFT_18865 [Macroventuria anomochaeta]